MPINMPDSPSQAMSVMPNMIANFGVGPATGYQAANQQIAGNNLLDLAQQGSQLGLDQQNLDLQNNYKNVPLQDAQRQLSLSNTKSDQAVTDSGLPQQDKLAKLQADIDNTNLDAKTKKQLVLGNQAESIDNSLGEDVSIDSAKNPARGKIIRQRWQEMGFPPLPDDGAEARAKIQQYADWNRGTGARVMENAKMKSQENIATIRGNAITTSASTRADATVESAQIRAQAQQTLQALKQAVASGDPKTYDGVMAKLQVQANANAAGRGPPLSEYEAGILDSYNAAKRLQPRGTAGAQLESVTSGAKGPLDTAVENTPRTPSTKTNTSLVSQDADLSTQTPDMQNYLKDYFAKTYKISNPTKTMADMLRELKAAGKIK